MGSGCNFLQLFNRRADLACIRQLERWNYEGNNILSLSQYRWEAETGRLHDIRRPKLGTRWVTYLRRVTEHRDALFFQLLTQPNSYLQTTDCCRKRQAPNQNFMSGCLRLHEFSILHLSDYVRLLMQSPDWIIFRILIKVLFLPKHRHIINFNTMDQIR
jgi:hypothetical protein